MEHNKHYRLLLDTLNAQIITNIAYIQEKLAQIGARRMDFVWVGFVIALVVTTETTAQRLSVPKVYIIIH
jgi:hypothetical protein